MGIHVRALSETDLPELFGAVERCGVFSSSEIGVAQAMLRDALAGEYEAMVAVTDGAIGYALFGATPFTESTWHLYWICVAPGHQRAGVGALLMAAAESVIRRSGGLRVIVETSSRTDYIGAQRLYGKAGYQTLARIPDYYKQSDDLLLLVKSL